MASGVELATAYVSLAVSTRGIGKGVSREFAGVERDADKAGKRIGGRLSAGIGGSLKSLAGIGAVLGVTDFLGDSIKEARESQKVGAITAQVIKATGGAAKISADQVGDLSTAISNKTGVDDEAIQAGANLLLTFKNVRNEVGKGANIFDRATAAAADLSAAGFGDMAGTSKQLGKALNDPVKGISALGRAGVTFTAQQKEQIKTLVKSGKTLDAQKIILGEVEAQVGGVAEASATSGEKLATSFGNFKEGIGTALLPILDTVFTKATEFLGYLTKNLGPALGKVGDFLSPVVDTVKIFIGTITGQGADVEVPWMNTVIDAGATVRDTFDKMVATIQTTVVPTLRTMVDFFIKNILPAFGQVKDFIVTEVVPRFLAIATAVQAFVTVAAPIIKGFVDGMIARITPLMPQIRTIFGIIGTIITGAMELIKAVIERVTAVISYVWEHWGTSIMDFIADVWQKIINIIKPALEGIQALIKFFTDIFKGDWSAAWEDIKKVVSKAFEVLGGIIDLALTGIKGALSAAWALIKTGAELAWGGIVSGIGSIWEGITGVLSGPIDRAMQFIQENLIDKINGLFSFLGLDLHITPIWRADTVGSGQRNAGRLGTSRKLGNRAFAGGGVLPGYTPGRDVHEFFSATGGRLALSGGEAIMRPEFTRLMGGPKGIAALNAAARGRQAFADGGVFGAIGDLTSGIGGFVTDPLGTLKKLIANVLSSVGSNPMAQLASGMVGKAMSFVIEKVSNLFSSDGGIAAGATSFGGYRVDTDTARRLQAAGGIRVIQGSWSHNPLSQGTHAGSGAVDVVASNWGAAVARLRAQGMLAMFRNWPGNQHIHALNPHVAGLSPQALAQVRRAQANGGIFHDGGVVKPMLYDQGGLLMPGLTLTNNKTGVPERVIPPGGSGDADAMAAAVERALSGWQPIVRLGDREVAGVMRRSRDYAVRGGIRA